MKTTDELAVWKESTEYMSTSSKGVSEKRKSTRNVTNTVLDCQFRGTTQQFVLHFNEKFRRLDDLPDISERMTEPSKNGIPSEMLLKISPNSALWRSLMNIPLPPVEMDHSITLSIHLTNCCPQHP